MRYLKIAALAGTAALAASILSGQASAMPLDRLTSVTTQRAALQDVRWVCGPYRCWWRAGPYWGGPHWGYWSPRPYWGWGGGWHRRWG
jgi:hypothetical protein